MKEENSGSDLQKLGEFAIAVIVCSFVIAAVIAFFFAALKILVN